MSIEIRRDGALQVSTSHSIVPKPNTSDARVARPSMASGAAQPGVPTGSPWKSGEDVPYFPLVGRLSVLLERALPPKVENKLKATPVEDVELDDPRFGIFFSNELSPKSVIFALYSSSSRTFSDCSHKELLLVFSVGDRNNMFH